MDNQSKPRICEVLGVEVEERFTIKDDVLICNRYYGCEMYIDRFGDLCSAAPKMSSGCAVSSEEKTRDMIISLIYAINHPACIVRERKFTEQEIADAKAIKRLIVDAVGIKREGMCAYVRRKWGTSPVLTDVAFPSIKPGELYTLDEIIGEAK